MASCSSFLSEEQFLCSVCLDVFNLPVSTPCGHNFCQACITIYWDSEAVYKCPLCKTTFQSRPDLKVNTWISGLAEQFKISLQLADNGSCSPDQQQPESGRVSCDICTDAKLEAVKSCVECQTSYCETHLEPHQRVAGLKRHTLVNPAQDLQDHVCKKHNKLLVWFCRTDKVVACDICARKDHVGHDTFPVQQEYREKRALLRTTEIKVQQMIQDRLQKVHEIKESMKLSQKDTKDKIAKSIQEFTALVSDIEESQVELVRVIEERQKAAEGQADDFIKDMEQEIGDLQMTVANLRDLMHIEDRLRFLEAFPSKSLLPHTMDWDAVSFNSLGMEHLGNSLSRTMSQLKVMLKRMKTEIQRFCDDTQMLSGTLWEVQQYEVDVVLDPDTAHPMLFVTEDRKRVSYSEEVQRIPTAKTFMNYYAVLGESGFSAGKAYYEVYVGWKIEFSLGVATESLNRTEAVREPRHGLWAIEFVVDKCVASSSPDVPVYWGKMERVGVFVDYEGGGIFFYDVEASKCIHSFTDCIFTETLYPYFNPCDNEYGSNNAPLVIVQVNHSE
ncbi:E3 ubiquitin-protein ligase TRIM68-like [Myripristis murdjan]|uniref:E3 ubiquitin-protein ligase TRIM68-like n=1 Tax=Myripristis murdjan TaxID=586833 RepID=A0A668A7R8_9TELE|nr:E3 ubiquitin-protein ligase TRIM68-like [Myripristis murdjan]XP_029934186.1 E3 ubiquitin-protein ligase TRIM68-like [Myripristis murdjan]XP_029934187.1 E3 ubiquitin-protein ligase TRIM68-like [Myripristis murdjan]